jgi:hypothetical protein
LKIKDGRFTEIRLSATLNALEIKGPEIDWSFERRE